MRNWLLALFLACSTSFAQLPCTYGIVDVRVVESPVPAVDCAVESQNPIWLLGAGIVAYVFGCAGTVPDGSRVLIVQRGGADWLYGHELAHLYGEWHPPFLPFLDFCLAAPP